MSIDTSSSSSFSQDAEASWISWMCSRSRNKFLCEVERNYIEDSFNLFGLKQLFAPYDYNAALDIILDKNSDPGCGTNHNAEILYGLVHARYIMSGQGLIAMHRKFTRGDFGECPRSCCESQFVLPVGMSDELGQSVKLFCPRCKDTFNPPSFTDQVVDGAFFGTTFPHLFLLTFEELVPIKPITQYVPRIFGFKIHPSSNYFSKENRDILLNYSEENREGKRREETDNDNKEQLAKKIRKSLF